MNKKDILSEDQKDFIFKCFKCRKEVFVEYGVEYNTQYSKIEMTEMTHPVINPIRFRSFAYICKDCTKKLKKEYGFI